MDFKEYCEKNGIIPLPQDNTDETTYLKKSPKKTQINTKFLQENTRYNHEVSNVDYCLIDTYSYKSEFAINGQKKIIKKLRRVKVCPSLDLHGLSKSEATRAIHDFILNNLGKTIKVIHGKGTNSPEHEPVLKCLVRRYLEFCDLVIAFSEGSQSQGGAGVTIVQLKKLSGKY